MRIARAQNNLPSAISPVTGRKECQGGFAPPSPTRTVGEGARGNSRRGSVLILVMWIVFGLVCIAVYFGHSMALEMRAADSRVSAMQADQAIEGAARYISFVLSNNPDGPGSVPQPQYYQAEAVAVGDAHFWLIGRTNDNTASPTVAHFGLIDEASKLNLNFADSNMLSQLPNMTADIAASIIAWRSTNTDNTSGGAESETYQRLNPPYLCKNAPFETVDELRLVYNMNMDLLYGEDANLNGVLDANENDGDATPPSDNQDGQLNPGLLEYVTVYTREPNITTNGTTRVNVTTLTAPDDLETALITNGISQSRAEQILANAGFVTGGGPGGPGGGRGGPPPVPTFTSPLQFYQVSQMTASEYQQVEAALRGSRVQGLVNVNTASAAVLACLPGMDSGKAGQLVSYRQSNPNNQNSAAWVTQVLDQNTLAQAGPWLTGKSYQFTADVAALGHHGRGYRRVRFVFDTSQPAPIVLYRQDLSHLGWALGKQVRDQWLVATATK